MSVNCTQKRTTRACTALENEKEKEKEKRYALCVEKPGHR